MLAVKLLESTLPA